MSATHMINTPEMDKVVQDAFRRTRRALSGGVQPTGLDCLCHFD